MDIQNLLGFLLPPVIDLINSRVADARARYWVAMVVCFAVGVVLNLDKIKDPQGLLASASLVFASAQITYHTYWEKSGARKAMFK